MRIPVDHRQLRKVVYLIGPAMILASAFAAWLGTADLLALTAGGALQLSFWLGPVGVIGVVFFSTAWWFGFSTLKRGGSALIIDSNGIEPPATVGGEHARIAWSDIEGWQFGYVSGQPLVHIVLKDPYTFIRRTRNPVRRMFGRANIRMVGTPVSVQLTQLGVSFEAMDEALTRFSGITQADEHDIDVAEDNVTIPPPTGVSEPDRQHQWIWAGVLVGIVAVLMTVGLTTTSGQDMWVTGFPWWFATAIGAGFVAVITVKDLLYGETPDLVACVTVTGETRPRESWIPTAMANELADDLRSTGLDARARYQPTALAFWAGTSLVGASIGSVGLGQVALGGGTFASWTTIMVGAAVLFGVGDAPRWGWVRRHLLRTTGDATRASE